MVRDDTFSDANHLRSALLECLLEQKRLEGGIERLSNILHENCSAKAHAVLEGSQKVLVGQFHDIESGFFFHVFHPFIRLTLWINHQRPAACLRHDDAILDANGVRGQSVEAGNCAGSTHQVRAFEPSPKTWCTGCRSPPAQASFCAALRCGGAALRQNSLCKMRLHTHVVADSQAHRNSPLCSVLLRAFSPTGGLVGCPVWWWVAENPPEGARIRVPHRTAGTGHSKRAIYRVVYRRTVQYLEEASQFVF